MPHITNIILCLPFVSDACVTASAGLPMWGAWCKTLVGGFSLGEWEPLCPRPTLPEAACNTAGGLGGAVSPPAGSGRERILAIMYIKLASCGKKKSFVGAPNCGGPGAAAPFAPLLIRHWLQRYCNAILKELEMYIYSI